MLPASYLWYATIRAKGPFPDGDARSPMNRCQQRTGRETAMKTLWILEDQSNTRLPGFAELDSPRDVVLLLESTDRSLWFRLEEMPLSRNFPEQDSQRCAVKHV